MNALCLQNHSPLPMQENSVVGEHFYAAGEDAGFDVFAGVLHHLRRVGVRDAQDFLFDDRAFVEVGAGEMRCCADDFDAALIGLVVGFCAFEAGQEGVVDVDDATGEPGGQIVAEDLHVAGEDCELGLCVFDYGLEGGFLFGLIVLCDGKVVEGDVVAFGEGAAGFVVGDDGGDLDIQAAGAGAVE